MLCCILVVSSVLSSTIITNDDFPLKKDADGEIDDDDG